MLPKKRRIQRKEFVHILSTGKRFNSPHLSLFLLKHPEDRLNDLTKFSFSVSKKVAKSAVERNKFRRRGYAAIAKHMHNIKNGYLMFFSYKKGVETLTFPLLEREIQTLLSASGVII